MLYTDGGWAWSSGIPHDLHKKLWGRQRSLPSPEYVAIGSLDRYYIRFEDGESEWVGCDTMTERLQDESSGDVGTVAFGNDLDSYFIVFEDGGYSYQEVPDALQELVQTGRQDSTDGECRSPGPLECVSLGPNDEWFLQTKTGKAWWDGMSEDAVDCMAEHCNQISFMDFADDDAYLFLYKE